MYTVASGTLKWSSLNKDAPVVALFLCHEKRFLVLVVLNSNHVSWNDLLLFDFDSFVFLI